MRYSVDVKCFLKVEVDAPNPEAAVEAAKGLVEASAPTAWFITGYNNANDTLIVAEDLAFDTEDPAVVEDEDGEEVEGFEVY